MLQEKKTHWALNVDFFLDAFMNIFREIRIHLFTTNVRVFVTYNKCLQSSAIW